MPVSFRTGVFTGILVLGGSMALYYMLRGKYGSMKKGLVSALDPNNFLPFVVHSNEQVSHNTRRIRFKLPEGTTTMGLTPVSAYVLTKFKPEGSEKAIIRPYTPITTEEESQQNGYFELVIKKYQNGPMSTHITSLKPGDILEIKGPGQKLDLDKDRRTNIGMVAGGTGITPMMQVIRHVLDPKNTSQKDKSISLIFGNVEERDILLRTELENLVKAHPGRFRVYYTLSKPPSGWKGGKGHVNQEMIKENLPSPSNENTLIMVCGPDGMLKHVCGEKNPDRSQGVLGGLLKDMKYNENQVFKF